MTWIDIELEPDFDSFVAKKGGTTGTLANQIYGKSKKSNVPRIPLKRINRVVDKAIKRNYFECFNTGLPALYGPHSSHPWVKLLKSLT